jgi:hypothetical protein
VTEQDVATMLYVIFGLMAALAVGVLVLLVFIIRRLIAWFTNDESNVENSEKPKAEKPKRQKRKKPPRRKAIYDAYYTDAEGEVWERKWHSLHFEPDPDKQSPQWIALPKINQINVAGTSFKEENCAQFFKEVNTDLAHIGLEWETEEETQGIRVIAYPYKGHEGLHVGYLPEEVYDEISGTYAREMPLGARLKKAGKHKTAGKRGKGFGCFFTIKLVGPGKAIRDTYLL